MFNRKKPSTPLAQRGWAWLIIGILIALLAACGAPNGELPPGDSPGEGPAAGDSDPVPVDPAIANGGAFVERLDVLVMESFPVQVRAQVGGTLADGCTTLQGTEVERDGSEFQILFDTFRDPDAVCTQALVPFETSVDLDVAGLPADTYIVRAGDLTETFTLDVANEAQTLAEEVQVYLIAVEDGGQLGELIGCNDSVVPVTQTIEPTAAPLTAALEILLGLDADAEGLYNALAASDLTLESAAVIDGEARIELSGQLSLGGVCDDPRVLAQLEQTAAQFATVNSVAITLNGEPLATQLGGQG